jgi:hypothetical protein
MVSILLVALALVFLVLAIVGKVPLWASVLCLILERFVGAALVLRP